MISTSEYNEAVKQLSRNLFRYLFKCLKSEEACLDIIQDCFEKLWKNRANVQSEKVKSWLFSTAHNLMINYIKREGKATEFNQEIHNINHSSSDNYDMKELINKALIQLPELQKSILLLRDYEGYQYHEIGEILELNESQVKVYLFRARKKLKETLKNMHSVL
ncbi:MAG: RNA polymerase sigma factor [Cytophagaceae bacterium]